MSDNTAALTSSDESKVSYAKFTFDEQASTFACLGNWSILGIGPLTDSIATDFHPPQNQHIRILGHKLEAFDSAGALLLLQFIDALKSTGNQVSLENLSDAQLELFELVQSKENGLKKLPESPELTRQKEDFLEFLGREAIEKVHQFDGLILLVGDLTDKIFRAFTSWKRFQIPSIISNINTTGLKALPIIALLSFLIGVVLAYQMGLQLETYGANQFIAYLCGMAIFREFGPLITAIIVAGRTSSSFTAQIGSMKLNEEIDALTTMGLSPTELLVLPKVIGLTLVLPLVVFWADIFGLMGSMFMSKFMLDIGYQEFLLRLQTDVGRDQFMLGLYKAPAFSILIALVGCFQGFQVKPHADSIGSQTTKSVVQALFLIIVADATYSIIYSWMDL